MEHSEYYEEYLEHHGVLGQKWGVRRFQNEDGTYTNAGKSRYFGDNGKNAVSLKAAGHKAAAKIYSINEKTYKKSNKTLSSMNKAAKEEQLKKAKDAQNAANEKANYKIKAKEEAKKASETRKEGLKKVDPELAKNKQTRRVAYDYHNLDDRKFKAKYQTSKDKFAKRYEKSDGDTYGMGKKKAAVGALIVANSNRPITYYQNGKKKTIETGAKAAAKYVAMDIGYSELVTRVGYNKSEEKYKQNNSK